MLFVPLRDLNPTRTRPWVNLSLLGINIIAFVYSYALVLGGAHWLWPAYGLVPVRLLLDPTGELFTVFTSMFLHGSIGHIGSNMLFLYIFGDNVEDALGHVRYLLFYLLCGLCAAAGQILLDPSSNREMIGASGAIAGVVGAYVVLYPRAPIISFNTVFLLWFILGMFPVVPAWLIAGMFFITNLSGLFGPPAKVAFAAHLGGFVAGLLLIRPWVERRRRDMASVRGVQSSRRNPRMRRRD